MANNSGELGPRIAAVRASGLFDEAEYEFLGEAEANRQDPVYHYLTDGEARGGRPSRRFDPNYYASKHGIKGDSPLIHYLLFGRKMGLRCVPVASAFTFVENGFREGFARSVLLAPDPGDSAACALALRLVQGLRHSRDIIVVCLDELPVQPAFREEVACLAGPLQRPKSGWDADPTEAAYLVAEIVDRYQPRNLLCCGIRGKELLPRFSKRSIPSVALVPGDVTSTGEVKHYNLYRNSTAIVFPDESIRSNHMACYPWLASRITHVLPLLSRDPPDVERTSDRLCSTLDQAQLLFGELAAKLARIENNDRVMAFITANSVDTRDIRQRLWENCITGGLSTGGVPAFPIPRLITGFDAAGYAAARKLTGGNPITDYLLEEQPDAFRRHVIRPPSSAPESVYCRAALHGHYFYTDTAEELLRAVAVNRQPVDLYLSTDTEAKAKELSVHLKRIGMTAEIRVFPNKGRDLGPLLTGFRDIFDAGYDVIGHVHGKKTAHKRPEFGERWRSYLLEHTVGGVHPMADAILSAFAQDERLGLVFPEDDRVLGWERNLEDARKLASDMNIGDAWKVPAFDFPAGSFFWCRPSALRPLLSLGLDWDDYPHEPLPEDGSLLHAIERMLGFVCEATGHHYATTHVRGLVR